MARVLIITESQTLAQTLTDRLGRSPLVASCHVADRSEGGEACRFEAYGADAAVYCPSLSRPAEMIPNRAEAAAVLDACRRAGMSQVVLIASAAVYGATPFNPGLSSESHASPRSGRDAISDHWLKLENQARDMLTDEIRLTILRPAAVLMDDGMPPFSQLFRQTSAATVPLYDPPLQLLAPEDLAEAVRLALERSPKGVYNVAPAGVIPLRQALRLAGVKAKPLAGMWRQRPDALHVTRGGVPPSAQLDYLRYNWTVSNAAIADALGFQPAYSSAEALLKFLQRPRPIDTMSFDDFGLDPDYIHAWQRRVLSFLHDRYWRIEVKGIEHVPRQGRAVMAGVHRGFMPYDGTMALHYVYANTGRFIRFLIHPSLVKTPFPFDFAKLGGLNACRENADYVLQRDGLLGFFPEGIQGAFTYYRDAYRLRKFSRDEYVKAALRNRAPIVPYVTVGSAEIFPVLAKIRWRWWKRYSLWPCFPIAPPFPFLPLPLPSKWHTQFLEPLHVQRDYPPEAADDYTVVRAISAEVRKRMQDAIDNLLAQRRSIFYGSIFNGAATDEHLSRT